jgi:hypothetical protein
MTTHAQTNATAIPNGTEKRPPVLRQPSRHELPIDYLDRWRVNYLDCSHMFSANAPMAGYPKLIVTSNGESQA